MEQSQSDNWLAVSGDFSECGVVDVEVQSEIVKKHLSSSSSHSQSPEKQSQHPHHRSLSKSQSVSSLSLILSPHPVYTLSPLQKWLLLPSYTVTFLAILPFINGCLYTVGYRIGRRVLKSLLNKIVKN